MLRPWPPSALQGTRLWTPVDALPARHPAGRHEGVQRATLEAHVLAELDVGDPPLADEAADEALPGAQVLGRLADGEQLTGVAEGHVPVSGRRWHRAPPWGCPGPPSAAAGREGGPVA